KFLRTTRGVILAALSDAGAHIVNAFDGPANAGHCVLRPAMTVSDVMNADVLSVAPTTPIEEARNLMRQRKIHHLVVQRGTQPMGVVSTHDLSSTRSTRRRPKTVADIMSRHLITIEGRASLDRAAYKMRNHAIGCLIVLNRGTVAGIVT